MVCTPHCTGEQTGPERSGDVFQVPLALCGIAGTRARGSERLRALGFLLCASVTMQLLDSQHLRAGRVLGDHLQPLAPL